LTGHPFVSLRQVLQGGMLLHTFPACCSSFASIVRLLTIFREVLPSIGHHLRSTILSQLSTIFVCAIFETLPASFASHYRIVPSTVCFISPSFGNFPRALPTDHFVHSGHHTVSTASRCLSCYNSFVCCNVYAGVFDRLCSFGRACMLPLCHNCRSRFDSLNNVFVCGFLWDAFRSD
jgi:hypothetical protein